MIPLEVVSYIYTFNPDHRELLKLCFQELACKFTKKDINRNILCLKHGPAYKVPMLLQINVNFYPLLNIIRQ